MAAAARRPGVHPVRRGAVGDRDDQGLSRGARSGMGQDCAPRLKAAGNKYLTVFRVTGECLLFSTVTGWSGSVPAIHVRNNLIPWPFALVTHLRRNPYGPPGSCP